MEKYIEIKGARVNNLKNVSLKIPRDKFIVITESLAPVNRRWLSTHCMPKVSDVMLNRYRLMPDSIWAECASLSAIL